MKKNLLLMAAIAMGAALSFTSCSDDNNDGDKSTDVDLESVNYDYTSENAAQWGNYMVSVASLLQNDATTLYKDWKESFNGGLSYADLFKNHDNTYYRSAADCVAQIFGGCVDIANEVGTTKIGDPYNKYAAGRKLDALYAVESWFSYHSIEDYSNNIRSIRNAYYGTYEPAKSDSEVEVNANSLSAVLAARNAGMDNTMKQLIAQAVEAIEAIPAPFRNHINSAEAKDAMDACSELSNYMEKTVAPYFADNITDETVLDPVIAQYVDHVVLPTYKSLMEKNIELFNVVKAFQQSPSNDNFEACAKAWMAARAPWETSEAFLYGPVSDKGLDPNMDSWPLDAKGITQILKSNTLADLDWDGDFIEVPEEDDEIATMNPDDLKKAQEIAAKQALRGFHTLEFLIYKNGKARTVK